MSFSIEQIRQFGKLVECIDNEQTSMSAFSSAFLTELKQLIYFDKGDIMLYAWSPEQQHYQMQAFFPLNWTKEESEDYTNIYMKMDDVLSILDQPGYIAYRNSDMFPQTERKKTTYFEQFAANADLEISIDANIPLPKQYGMTAILGIFRGTEKVPFDEQHLALIKAIQPHLSRGITRRLNTAPSKQRGNENLPSPMPDSFPYLGWFTVNEEFQVTSGSIAFQNFYKQLDRPGNRNPLMEQIIPMARKLQFNPQAAGLGPFPYVINGQTCWIQMDFSDSSRETISGMIYFATIMFREQLSRLKETGHLSDRETEVIMLMLKEGLSHTELAERLCITTATVKRHLYNVYQKLGINHQRELLRMLNLM